MRPLDKLRIHQAIDVLKNNDFSNKDEVVNTLYRVLKTKQSAKDKDFKPKDLYQLMQTETKFLGRFPGDEILFNELYEKLSILSTREVLFLINALSDIKEVSAPTLLIKKFEKYIDTEVRNVLIFDCDKYGSKFLNLIEQHPQTNFTLTSRKPLYLFLLKLIFAQTTNVTVKNDTTNGEYDLILSIPPFGKLTSLAEESPVETIGNSLENHYLQLQVKQLSARGKLAIILPTKSIQGGGSNQKIRQNMLNQYNIEEISSLPSIFMPAHSIKTYCCVITNVKSNKVTIRQYDFTEKLRYGQKPNMENLTLKVVQEKTMTQTKLASFDNWNTDLIFLAEDKKIQRLNDATVNKSKLKDVAKIMRGQAVSAKSNKGEVAIINISDFGPEGINYSALNRIPNQDKFSSSYLQEGDVLLTTRGTVLRTEVFHEQEFLCIASANLSVIRPNQNLRGTYLKIFLNSETGKKLLYSLHRGGMVINLNHQDIQQLTIPVPSLEHQDKLIEKYHNGLTEFINLIKEAKEKWHKLKTDIEDNLY